MSVTTIKLQRKTKFLLDKFRMDHESYDVLLQRLLFLLQQRDLHRQLKQAYQMMGKEDLALLEEWEPASQEVTHASH